MEPLYRDFTVCKNCGANCYLNNSYCEDCANELFEAECGINSQLMEENKILKDTIKTICLIKKNTRSICDICGKDIKNCTFINDKKLCDECCQKTYNVTEDYSLEYEVSINLNKNNTVDVLIPPAEKEVRDE